jgi:hypothetical protein
MTAGIPVFMTTEYAHKTEPPHTQTEFVFEVGRNRQINRLDSISWSVKLFFIAVFTDIS